MTPFPHSETWPNLLRHIGKPLVNCKAKFILCFNSCTQQIVSRLSKAWLNSLLYFIIIFLPCIFRSQNSSPFKQRQQVSVGGLRLFGYSIDGDDGMRATNCDHLHLFMALPNSCYLNTWVSQLSLSCVIVVNLHLCVLLLVDVIQEVVFGICHLKFTYLTGHFAENSLQLTFNWKKEAQ